MTTFTHRICATVIGYDRIRLFSNRRAAPRTCRPHSWRRSTALRGGGLPSGPNASSRPAAGSRYRAGARRDGLKTRVNETGVFVITGLARCEAVAVTELRDAVLVVVEQVKIRSRQQGAAAAA